MFTTSDIEKYFNGEKQGGLLFLIIAAGAVITAVVFFFACKTNFYKGAALPLLLVGLLSGIVGFTVYKRSDADRVRNVYAYGMNPSELKNKELPRMRSVVKSFVTFLSVEIVLALAGIALFFYFKNDENKIFWKGFGLALAAMALIILVADYYAAQRGRIYLNGLEQFTQQNKV